MSPLTLVRTDSTVVTTGRDGTPTIRTTVTAQSIRMMNVASLINRL